MGQIMQKGKAGHGADANAQQCRAGRGRTTCQRRQNMLMTDVNN
jgi:hypothetical protein